MTKRESAFRIPISTFAWLLFAAVVVFVYFFGLTIPLVGPDEPRYAQVAREMFERGDWVTPTLGGFHWFEKPALLYWLQIAAYEAFGVSEFSARLGPALFGLGTIASLWVLGRSLVTKCTGKEEKLVNGSRQNSEFSVTSVASFANWLALIAASSIGIIVFSRGASFDIILTFPITAAMVSFFIFDLTQSRKKAKPQSKEPIASGQNISASPRFRVSVSLFAFYFFIGAALLAKGLVGIVFPFAIVGFYYLLSWRFPSRAFWLSLVWGTLVSALVAATWYWPMYQRNGWEFIDEFFIQHHFQRFMSNKYFHPQPFYFFFWVLPLMTIPWLPFFVGAIWTFGKKIFHHRDTENAELISSHSPRLRVAASPQLFFSLTLLLRFAVSWLLVPLVFFSFSGSKLPGYILPSVPPALILTAVCVFRFVEKSEIRARLVLATALATFIVVVGLIILVVPRFADTDSVKSLIGTANENGYRSENILTLHTVSHNAEFYASGRILRDDAGKQRKLLGPAEVADEIRKNDGKPVLVLVPLEYLKQLLDSPLTQSTLLKDNGELAIVFVRAK